ncbi:hypothetical protein ES703_113204 [subsurface metagenome]
MANPITSALHLLDSNHATRGAGIDVKHLENGHNNGDTNNANNGERN